MLDSTMDTLISGANWTRPALKGEAVGRDIRLRISRGELAPGDRLPTERELSRIFNVSVATVRTGLKTLEDDRVLRRVQGCGTFVASALEDAQSHHVTFFHYQQKEQEDTDSHNPYSAQIISGICGELSKVKGSFSVVDCGSPGEVEPGWIPTGTFHRHAVLSNSLATARSVEALKSAGINVAILGVPSEEVDARIVDIDVREGMRLAVGHLFSMGYRKPAAFLPPWKGWRSAYLDALRRNGASTDEAIVAEVMGWNRQSGVSTTLSILEGKSKFDSLIVYGDWATVGAVETLRGSGLRIPEDVGVVMYDDYKWVSEIVSPRLTAVNQPFREQAALAARSLIETAASRMPGNVRVIMLNPTLNVRDSTKGILNPMG